MANYKTILEKRAAKELKKLPPPVQQQIVTAIDKLGNNPRPAATKQLVGVEGWRLRLGDYRIIYTISDATITVYIIKLDHRREIYR